ncbi:polymeric immunoglobulin receptor-like isoform X2 [Paramormyrops kingsleyae]|uniref:polymeric immunoglobulin receptor-like isoform X2 n=1 Tax=Paramormyrops kingsleyae TaxID=1676925 RepID=UPI003B972773
MPPLLLLFIVMVLPAIIPVRSYGQKTLRGTETRSNSAQSKNRVSISDEPHNLVFIVTMRNLQKSDEGSYWCSVVDGLIYAATSDEEYMLIATAEERNSNLKTFSYLRGQTGGSITIPCFYGQEHKHRVKYWCKSENIQPCTPTTKVTKGTIADVQDKLVFLLNMTNLQQSDSGNYQCFVGERNTKEMSDNLFFLVTPTAQSVRTESWVSARRGGPATISCYYDQNYKDKTKYLCRGYERDSCSTIAQSDGEQSRGKVSVSDDRDQMVFNVIIRNLQEKDFDYYWCAVEASAAQNDRAFVPLIVREVTPVSTTQQTEQDHHTTLRATVSSPRPLSPNSTRQNATDSSYTTLLVSVGIVGLLLLLTVVMVTMILRKRSAITHARNRNRENTADLSPSVDPSDEVTYISVTAKARNMAASSSQVKPLENMTSADPNETYSNTTTQRKKAAADPHEVTYSAVVRK